MTSTSTSTTVIDGKISYENFLSACKQFVSLPPARRDGWSLEGEEGQFGEAYLSMKTFRKKNETLLQFRYDVLYSVSHAVPVLHFTVTKANGEGLGAEEVWGLFELKGEEELWNMVSMQDHPVIHLPFYVVHPCNTGTLMREIESVRAAETDRKVPHLLQYLISWLSLVGSKFGIKLSTEYVRNSL